MPQDDGIFYFDSMHDLRCFKRVCMLAISIACLSLACMSLAQAQSPQNANNNTGTSTSTTEAAAVDFFADSVETNQETGVFIATGNVEFSQGRMRLIADRVEYDRTHGTAVAMGNVVFTDFDGGVHYSEHLALSDEFTRAFAEPAISRLVDGSWLAGESVAYIQDEEAVYTDANFTPCQCDYVNGEEPIWEIAASRIRHDAEARTIYYRNIHFRLLTLPVFYFPYLSHPDWTVRRHSGWLFPSFTYSSDHGFSYAQSYYSVIDDTSDLEIKPIFYQRSGQMLQLNYRKLWDEASLNAVITGGHVSSFQKDRQRVAAINSQFNTTLGEGWKSEAHIYRTSQDTFMRRYGLDSNTTLKSFFKAENIGDNTYSRVDAFDIQGLERDEEDEDEPSVFPSVFYEEYLPSPRESMQVRLRLAATHLDNDEQHDITRWSGEIYTAEDFPAVHSVVSFESRVNMQYYGIDTVAEAGGYTGELGRGSASFGLGWERPYVGSLAGSVFVLEPKAKLVVTEATDRTGKIPNRDTADFHLDEANLFFLHRYQGEDFVRSGSQLSAGVHALLDYNGASGMAGEMTGFVGASYRTSGDPTLGINSTNEERRLSDLLARLTFRLTDILSANFAGRFDPDNFDINQSQATADLNYQGLAFSASYKQRKESFFNSANLEEETLLMELAQKLNDGLELEASWQYDLTDNTRLHEKSSVALNFTGGLQDCLTISLKYTRDETEDRDIRPIDEVALLLDFKYLGSVVSDDIKR
ncbi:MAG: LPS assembly protein LptD [Proteobacteria bacterium]|nr:LPS assembly protein LptD [Pseudomonadota bacterium]